MASCACVGEGLSPHSEGPEKTLWMKRNVGYGYCLKLERNDRNLVMVSSSVVWTSGAPAVFG